MKNNNKEDNLEQNIKMEMEAKEVEKDDESNTPNPGINGTTRRSNPHSNNNIEEYNNYYYKILQVPSDFFEDVVKAILRCLGFEEQHSSSSEASSESTVCRSGVQPTCPPQLTPDVCGGCSDADEDGDGDDGGEGGAGDVTDPGADDSPSLDGGDIETKAIRKPPRPGLDKGRPGQVH